MLQYPRAIIFDWDNTLVDSWPAIAEAINLTRKAMGHDVWSLDEVRAKCTRAARDSFPEWFGDAWERAYEIYYTNFDNVRKSRALEPMNGALQLLDTVKELGIPAFIVSNKRGDYLRHEIERLEWQKYFVNVAGAQDAPRDKPAREHVDFALQGSGMVPDHTVWLVGDSETDFACAVNAGCTPVIVGTTYKEKPDYVPYAFADCHELHDMLNTLIDTAKM